MDINIFTIIFAIVNLALLFAIIFAIHTAVKKFKSFVNRNRAIDEKLDIILSKLDSESDK